MDVRLIQEPFHLPPDPMLYRILIYGRSIIRVIPCLFHVRAHEKLLRVGEVLVACVFEHVLEEVEVDEMQLVYTDAPHIQMQHGGHEQNLARMLPQLSVLLTFCALPLIAHAMECRKVRTPLRLGTVVSAGAFQPREALAPWTPNDMWDSAHIHFSSRISHFITSRMYAVISTTLATRKLASP